MSFLKVVVAEFDARDLSCDRKHGHAAAIAVEQPINKVQVPGAATAGAYRQLVGQVSLGARGKSASFFMSDVNPFDAFVCANAIRECVEGISGYAIHTADAGIEKHLNENFGRFHDSESPWQWSERGRLPTPWVASASAKFKVVLMTRNAQARIWSTSCKREERLAHSE